MSYPRTRAKAAEKPQQVTRIPPFRPGMWVRLKSGCAAGEGPLSLSGEIRKVKSLTCSITSPDQQYAVWRVHFEDGRCVEWHVIERPATPEEIRQAEGRKGASRHA